MEIIKLDKLTKEDTYLVYPEENISEYQKFEYAVISNPPKNVQKIIEKYLKDHVDRNSIEQKCDMYTLQFYEETSKTPRNYAENEGYLSKDRIDNHIDDLIAKVEWKKCGSGMTKGKWTISVKDSEGLWEDITISDFCNEQ